MAFKRAAEATPLRAASSRAPQQRGRTPGPTPQTAARPLYQSSSWFTEKEQRHAGLPSYGARSAGALLDALRQANRKRCVPPLEGDNEIEQIAKWPDTPRPGLSAQDAVDATEVRAVRVMDADFMSSIAFTRKAFSANVVVTPKNGDERSVWMVEPLREILVDAADGKKPTDRLVTDEHSQTPSRQKLYKSFITL